ncbi:MAG: aminoglycoside 3'-phosphotransferase [Devosia sp.]|nr:aminoglycoside 3'-phosphotransferase [Devosia sp.]
MPQQEASQGGWVDMPPAWAERLSGYAWRRQTIGESQAAVFRLDAAESPALFVKTETEGPFSELPGEAARLGWLSGQGLPCAEVLSFELHDGRNWLLMTEVAGSDLASVRGMPPRALINLAVAALRRLHALPIQACPFDHQLPLRLDAAEARWLAGLVDIEDLDDERAGRDPSDLMAELRNGTPADFDLVVTHGDACLPNFLANGDGFSGYVDCGRLGVADRHQDLALMGRSIGFNLGDQWIEPFYEEYGLSAPDRAKLGYYRLLDEFF